MPQLQKTLNDYLPALKATHGDRYTYKRLIRNNNGSKTVVAHCERHGRDFRATLHNHMAGGKGCPECIQEGKRNGRTRRTSAELIQAFREVHGDRYDYSDVEYTDRNTSVTIHCNLCGHTFTMTPHNHQHNLRPCPECGGNGRPRR